MVKNTLELGRGIAQNIPDHKDNESFFRSVLSCMDFILAPLQMYIKKCVLRYQLTSVYLWR